MVSGECAQKMAVVLDGKAEVELNFNIFAWNLLLWMYRNS